MSSVREVTSWQDAYIFCLQPDFKDDLWLFMIFAAIQVSIAGLKLTSFFINRWARGAKVGSGDEDEENVGDDGASGGISIMGVLTLIAGSLILAAYCEDEPDERTFNVFKAGVYLNTFLFAVALIFICGLVVAFVLDIITRRRGRSITFRMFLGGTIVLSIAAAFFGATGIMGLKYVQSDCYDEVDLYFNSNNYLQERMFYADENVEGSYSEPTKESLYEEYQDKIIGDPHIFEIKDATTSFEPFYVSSVVYNTTATRRNILDMRVKRAVYVKTNEGTEDEELIRVSMVSTDAPCFETGFVEVGGLLSCKIRYSEGKDDYAKYEEATKKIVSREGCANKDDDIVCKEGSKSYPLCCDQFNANYEGGAWKDCHCMNNVDDASCGFDKDIDCTTYRKETLDLDVSSQKDYFCDNYSTLLNPSPYCAKDAEDKYTWNDFCKDGDKDAQYYCCVNAWDSFEWTWKKYGEELKKDMTPKDCNQFESCHTAEQFYGGCCSTSTNPGCDYCKNTDVTLTNEALHAGACGYDHCYDLGIMSEKKECCEKAKNKFGITFEEGSTCHTAINYDPCKHNTKSLACSETRSECNESKDCFPNCCGTTNFDFSTDKTIADSIASDCFQLAPERVKTNADKQYSKHHLGQYIYHHTGASKRASCSAVKGIIDPKCCNENYSYHVEDPCYCHGVNPSSNRCKQVHHSECIPEDGASAYPQCCFEIGDFFGVGHFCTCRLSQDPREQAKTCNDVSSDSNPFEFTEKCPNPCKNQKALLTDGSLICEEPVFELY